MNALTNKLTPNSVIKDIYDYKGGKLKTDCLPVYVYALQLKNKSNVKIGRSIRPDVRIRTLVTQTGQDINQCLIYHLKVKNAQIEIYLHKKFKKNRILGEWFDVSIQQVTEEIRKLSIENFDICNSSTESADRLKREAGMAALMDRLFATKSPQEGYTTKDIILQAEHNVFQMVFEISEQLGPDFLDLNEMRIEDKEHFRFNIYYLYSKYIIANDTLADRWAKIIDEHLHHNYGGVSSYENRLGSESSRTGGLS